MTPKKMGRPRVDTVGLYLRVDAALIEALDAYAARRSISRNDAIRDIMARAVDAEPRAERHD